MTVEQFRAALRAQPFRPFVMHLADGREVPVKHPELAVSTSTHGETVRAFLPRPCRPRESGMSVSATPTYAWECRSRSARPTHGGMSVSATPTYAWECRSRRARPTHV